MVPPTWDRFAVVASSWGASFVMRSGGMRMLGPATLTQATTSCRPGWRTGPAIVEVLCQSFVHGAFDSIFGILRRQGRC